MTTDEGRQTISDKNIGGSDDQHKHQEDIFSTITGQTREGGGVIYHMRG
jgi:hypothetical protein